MNTKEFLNEYLICQGRINSKQEKILELKQRATATAYVMSEKVQTSKQINGTEKIISMYIDMQNELVADLKILLEKQKEITAVIDKCLSGLENEVVERKYINGQTFLTISKKIDFSERQTLRIHGKALEKIDEYMSKLL